MDGTLEENASFTADIQKILSTSVTEEHKASFVHVCEHVIKIEEPSCESCAGNGLYCSESWPCL